MPKEVLPQDPLAAFSHSQKEATGVTVDVEDPRTGEVLMTWRLARFGGSNSTHIIRVDRELRSRLTQGQRRAIEAGVGDPDVVRRLNRMIFVRVSVLGFEAVHPVLRERYPEYTPEVADSILEAYPIMWDVLSEQACDEDKFAEAELADATKN